MAWFLWQHIMFFRKSNPWFRPVQGSMASDNPDSNLSSEWESVKQLEALAHTTRELANAVPLEELEERQLGKRRSKSPRSKVLAAGP